MLAGMGIAVLVILPQNPGDVVMALQAIRRLKAEIPELEVDYLVSEACGDLVRGSPLLRKVHVLPKPTLKALCEAGGGIGGMEGAEAFLQDIAAVRYDLSLNLFQEKAGGIIQEFVRADRKAGLERVDGRDFRVSSRFMEHLFAIPADRRGNAWHAVDIYVRAGRRALESPPPSLPVPAEGPGLPWGGPSGPDSIFPPLARPPACASLVEGEYLVFHPGSAWPGKRWPPAHWAGLASRCVEAGLRIVFTGAPDERPLMDRILGEMAPAARNASIDCAGLTDLPGAAWICAHARLVVTGDTVAMHLAAASGAPTLSLFGASNPVETGPYGKGHVLIQTDPEPAPDLAFGREHPGLCHLSPTEVADYLLEGIPPPGFPLWETGWDRGKNRQILRDYRGQPPPGSQRAHRLMDMLDRLADKSDTGGIQPLPKPGGPAERLRGLLLAAAAMDRLPDGLLIDIESSEKELSRETEGSLVWEAYRIAVNGLPTRDLRGHLAARLARLDRAVKEESLTGNP